MSSSRSSAPKEKSDKDLEKLGGRLVGGLIQYLTEQGVEINPESKDRKPLLNAINTYWKEKEYAADLLTANNNVVCRIVNNKTNKTEMILQFSNYTKRQAETVEALGKPSWLAKTYAQTKEYVAGNITLEEKKRRDNDKSEDRLKHEYYFATAQESLTGGNLYGQKRNEEIQKIVPQISSMLEEMSKKGVVWLDMKPGNILLRENGGTAISDVKGLFREDLLRTFRDNVAKKDVVILDGVITESCLSRWFLDNYDNMGKGEVKNAMEKEYSYQLGCIIYKMATGQDKLNWKEQNETDKDDEFDFDKKNARIFNKTNEGLRLKYIIGKLCADNPNERMSHKEAATLVSNLSNDSVFKDHPVGKVGVGFSTSPTGDEKVDRDATLQKERATFNRLKTSSSKSSLTVKEPKPELRTTNENEPETPKLK